MKYEEKYKDKKFNDLETVSDDTLLYTKKIQRCVECGSQTHFVDYCFEMPICSEECNKAFEKRFK